MKIKSSKNLELYLETKLKKDLKIVSVNKTMKILMSFQNLLMIKTFKLINCLKNYFQ